MKDNKLIAEFMEVHEIMHDGYSEHDFDDNTLDVVAENELRYHESWDWLMPVVHKIKNSSGQGIFMMEIGLPIEHVYKAVVEFIKEHNRTTDYNKVTYYDGQ